MVRVLTTLLLALSVAACGSGGERATGKPGATTSASDTPSATLSITPTTSAPAPVSSPKDGVSVTYKCEGATYYTMQEAWVGQHYNCINSRGTGTPNQREQAAVRMAYNKRTASTRDVVILYGICGSNNAEWPLIDLGETMAKAAAQETKGAAMLCPTHPNIANLAPALAASAKQARADMNRMEDGTYLVGEDINPGVYIARPTGSCYWERDDASGNIIDNNFTNGARVEMTIEASDYSVSVQGCGEWKRTD